MPTLSWPLLFAIVTGLLAVNAFFVAAEFALVCARPTQIEHLADAGHPVARRLRRLFRDARLQDKYLATAQVGVQLASVGLGMFGEQALAGRFAAMTESAGWGNSVDSHLVAGGLAVGLLTLLHVIFGEIVPRRLVLERPETAALRLVPPMGGLRIVAAPLVAVIHGLSSVVLRLAGVADDAGHFLVMSSEELEIVIDESTESGELRADAGPILQSVFDFSERSVRQVMTPRTRLEAFPVTISERELAGRLVQARHTRFPIFDGDLDHVVGIIHMKDYVRYRMRLASDTTSRARSASSRTRSFSVRQLMGPVRHVPDGMSLDAVLEVFKREKLSLAIVLDEFGGTAGLVTVEDLIEEVVGDVQDEFDEARVPVETRRPGALAVRGDVQLADLADYGVPLADDRPDVDTVGGLVLALLGRPARRGDAAQLGAVAFTVEKVRERAIELVRVEFPPGEE